VCATATTVFDVINTPAFLADVTRKGTLLRASVTAACAGNPAVVEARGSGLLVGVQLTGPAGKVVDAARARGLLIITAGKGDVVRLVPPLVVTDAEIGQCAKLLAAAIDDVYPRPPPAPAAAGAPAAAPRAVEGGNFFAKMWNTIKPW